MLMPLSPLGGSGVSNRTGAASANGFGAMGAVNSSGISPTTLPLFYRPGDLSPYPQDMYKIAYQVLLGSPYMVREASKLSCNAFQFNRVGEIDPHDVLSPSVVEVTKKLSLTDFVHLSNYIFPCTNMTLISMKLIHPSWARSTGVSNDIHY